MNIVFFCQSCGARFEVDPRMAGKKGHCKKCGQYMSIPRAQEIASMAAMPALAMAGAGAVAGASGPSIGTGSARMTSQVGLAPITIDRMPAGRREALHVRRRRPPTPSLTSWPSPSGAGPARAGQGRPASSRGSGGGSSAGSRSSSASSTRPPTWSRSRSS